MKTYEKEMAKLEKETAALLREIKETSAEILRLVKRMDARNPPHLKEVENRSFMN